MENNNKINPSDYLEAGIFFHGHKCPAMPSGLRAGAIAMNILGVKRAKDGELLVLLELGDSHFATCFADGIQMITGCTFGKGNIKKLHYGKWGFTLVDLKSNKAIRISPRSESMLANKNTDFFVNYRTKGVPASKVPENIVSPLVEKIMTREDKELFTIGEIFEYEKVKKTGTFASFICDECNEMVVERYGRPYGEKKLCQPCYNKITAKK